MPSLMLENVYLKEHVLASDMLKKESTGRGGSNTKMQNNGAGGMFGD